MEGGRGGRAWAVRQTPAKVAGGNALARGRLSPPAELGMSLGNLQACFPCTHPYTPDRVLLALLGNLVEQSLALDGRDNVAEGQDLHL